MAHAGYRALGKDLRQAPYAEAAAPLGPHASHRPLGEDLRQAPHPEALALARQDDPCLYQPGRLGS